VSAKLNTYVSGNRVSHNLSYGFQISRNQYDMLKSLMDMVRE